MWGGAFFEWKKNIRQDPPVVLSDVGGRGLRYPSTLAVDAVTICRLADALFLRQQLGPSSAIYLPALLFPFLFFFSGTHTLYTSEILCIRKRRKIFCVCVCFCLEVARRKQHSGKILFALVRHRLAYHACLHLMHRA